ncbi:PQQ-binding-like beta-propeller repeat protein [Acidicapsa dinghuensis]|uniref:PQQ-binding-like beta-propeller repeat protein n=1 Tax=Acidicapsa dinghuensis TaxID=2218256 RepID=A0ABW1EDN4_9BACT|nr:PQQ-binding-like beta-propeller repeat protein [Acidicapsa dinghuensis]
MSLHPVLLRIAKRACSLSFRQIGLCTAMVAMLACLSTTSRANAQDWPQFGQNNTNSASNFGGLLLNSLTVPYLKPKWTFTTAGDVSARAAVVNGVAYVPDWGGNLWAIRAIDGKQLWGGPLANYNLLNNTTGQPYATVYARATPLVVNGIVYLGVQQGAWFLALDASSGKLLWKTQLNTFDPYAVVTTSASYANGVIYTGVASSQEANAAGAPGTAKGSVAAINAANGKILWQTYTTVAGYSGVGVWGSNPVVDTTRGTVFIGTGDNYTAPTDPKYLKCVAAGGTPAVCQSSDNHVDSILALNMSNGKIKWSQSMVTWPQFSSQSGSDFFNLSCSFGLPGCPSPQGPDFDFGSAPNEITYLTPQGPKTILGAGQKSGIYFAFDPDTGKLLWQTQVGPGSSLGGMEWGSATDGFRIYVAVANFYGIPYGSNSNLGTAGTWAALDPATGKILWQVADPNGAADLGPLAVANGVVFAASMAGGSSAPTMLALDASSGKTLWSYPSGASTISGATVVNNTVFWGSGYTHLGIPGMTGNNKFYAFTLGGY